MYPDAHPRFHHATPYEFALQIFHFDPAQLKPFSFQSLYPYLQPIINIGMHLDD